MDQTQTKNNKQLDDLFPQVRERLSNHGIDTSKLDDQQWREVVGEIQPLFSGAQNAGGGGTYGR